MKNILLIQNKINSFNNSINVSGDKSLSIRWAIMSAQALGKSKAFNLLNSEDVNNALIAIKKLGIKVVKKKDYCEIFGRGLNGFSFSNNTTINAQNSGTFARLILGVLAKTKKKIILKGDKSLSNRDFSRVIEPLNKFGVKIISKKNKLPLKVCGTEYLRPINYEEYKGSAQVKSCIMLAALNTPGITKIKCKPSRNHTELLFKYLKLNINIQKKNSYDVIKIKGGKQYKGFNYIIPGDISSASFFIVLTLLSKNSKLVIKNINVNETRTGIIDILKKMNGKIILKNKRQYKGEKVADIYVTSSNKLKSINCPKEMNSRLIDELPLIFLVSAKAKGISRFENLDELRHKESDRLKLSSKFLNMLGIKNEINMNSFKIKGNPNLLLSKNFTVKDFFKDHRIFMLSCIAALTLGGTWKIHDKNSVNTSFPNFLKTLKELGGKFR